MRAKVRGHDSDAFPVTEVWDRCKAGAAAWHHILNAIERLQARKPTGVEAVHLMKDVLALAAAAAWFALNIVLWIVIEIAVELFGWSLAMGAAYFAGFFAYLGHHDRGAGGLPH